MRRSSTTSVVTLLALTSLCACGGSSRASRYDPLVSPERIARAERNLIELASRESGCSPVQVAPMRVAETVWVANTCTGPREYFLDCRQRHRRWANCRWDRIAAVVEAAAQVLACPPAAIQQQAGPSPLSRTAEGCGMHVAMSLRCNDVGCGWIADAAPAGAHAGSLAPAPPIVVIPAPPP